MVGEVIPAGIHSLLVEEGTAGILALLVKVGTAVSQALDSHGPPVWALDVCGPPVWALDARGPPIWALDAQAPPTQVLVPPLHTAWGIWLMCAHKPHSQGITLPWRSLKKPPSHHPRPPAVAAVAVAAVVEVVGAAVYLPLLVVETEATPAPPSPDGQGSGPRSAHLCRWGIVGVAARGATRGSLCWNAQAPRSSNTRAAVPLAGVVVAAFCCSFPSFFFIFITNSTPSGLSLGGAVVPVLTPRVTGWLCE
ncbi:UNVERIFIED_CONTAM: hypothetical protein FKN15_048772 [Acipenser sinensis]